MKDKLLLLLILLGTKTSLAQITFDDLLKIQKSDAGTTTELLISKNWQLISSTEETETEYGTMSWAYNVSEYESEKASAWINIDYSETSHNRIGIQFFYKSLYVKLKEKVLAYGMKKINYGLVDGYSFIDYAGVNYVVRIGVGSNSDSNVSRYIFLVWNKKDYLTKDE